MAATLKRREKMGGGLIPNLKVLVLSGLTWAAATAAGLWLTRSTLLQDMRRR